MESLYQGKPVQIPDGTRGTSGLRLEKILQFEKKSLILYLFKYLNMQVVNYTEFRNNLAKSLNMVNDNSEVVVVSRSKGKNVVVMSLEEYNSIQETLHLVSSKANQKRLDAAIEEMQSGKSLKHDLIEK
jgi:antitoxin YefM